MHCGSRSGHDARLQPSGFLQLRTVAVLLFRASAARTYHSCGKTQSEMITQSDQTWTYVSQQQQFGTRRVRMQVRPILPLHEAIPYSIPVCFCFCLCFYFCRQMDRSHRPHAPQRAQHKAEEKHQCKVRLRVNSEEGSLGHYHLSSARWPPTKSEERRVQGCG